MTNNEEEHLFVYLLAICVTSFVKCLCVLVSFPSRCKLYSSIPGGSLAQKTLVSSDFHFVLPYGRHPLEGKSRKEERMGIPWLLLCWVTAGWLTLSTKGHNSCHIAL